MVTELFCVGDICLDLRSHHNDSRQDVCSGWVLRLISMTFDWLKIFCSQSKSKDFNTNMSQFLNQNVYELFKFLVKTRKNNLNL